MPTRACSAPPCTAPVSLRRTVRLKADTTYGRLVRLKADTTYGRLVRLKADTTYDHRLHNSATHDYTGPPCTIPQRSFAYVVSAFRRTVDH
jgi:hypothetical protein